MEEWVSIISSIGIPGAIAFYVLIRLEGTVNKNTEAIKEMIILLQNQK